MVIIPTSENFAEASGIFSGAALENIYHAFIDTAFVQFSRILVLHLKPAIQADTTTNSQAQAQQYNPFFGRVPVPNTNTRNAGVKITPRDVQYHAMIKIGPLALGPSLYGSESAWGALGIGKLEANEAMITLPIEALNDLGNTLSISIEGRRYSISSSRPVGFSRRRYILVLLREIQEKDTDTQENAG